MKTLFITTALALFAAPAIAETKWQWGCEWQKASNGNYWFRVDGGCDFPGAARAGTPPGGGHSQGAWLGDLLETTPAKSGEGPGEGPGDDNAGPGDEGSGPGDEGPGRDKPGKGKPGKGKGRG